MYDACRALRRGLISRATEHPRSVLRGRPRASARFEDGRLFIGDDSVALGDIARLVGYAVEAEGSIEPGENQKKLAQYAYGAHFVEVAVDAATGEIRLRRALGAFSFGRVLNPLTARSQLLGGVIFGFGGALTEALLPDERLGAVVNRDLAEYHLAVQRDVPPIEIMMIGEPDDRCGPLGSKGIGELGVCGVAGAVSNAVFHATGVRIRDFPMTPDRVLEGLLRER